MSHKHAESDSPLEGLTNEATRKRWELFHRAIEHAKRSNVSALREEHGIDDDENPSPLNSVAG